MSISSRSASLLLHNELIILANTTNSTYLNFPLIHRRVLRMCYPTQLAACFVFHILYFIYTFRARSIRLYIRIARSTCASYSSISYSTNEIDQRSEMNDSIYAYVTQANWVQYALIRLNSGHHVLVTNSKSLICIQSNITYMHGLYHSLADNRKCSRQTHASRVNGEWNCKIIWTYISLNLAHLSRN